MGQVKIVAQFKAKSGKTTNATKAVKGMVAVAKGNPGIVGYEVHALGDSIMFVETYKDSKALMSVFADPKSKPAMDELFANVDLVVTNVLGDASAEVKAALTPFGAKFYAPVAAKA